MGKLGRPKELQDRRMIQVNIENRDYEALKELAEREETTISKCVRDIIRESLIAWSRR